MAKYMIEMTVGLDGVPQVTGGLQQIDSAADRMGTRTQTATGRMAAGMGDIENAAGRMAGGMDTATGRMAGSLGALQTSMMGLAAGFTLGTVISQLHSAGMAIERLNNSFEAATGSVAGGAASMQFVRAEAQRLGLDLLSTADSYMKLAAAARGTALEGDKTRQIFSAVAGASRSLGLSAEQTNGALMAISQMMSKGSVMAEELRGQLGERLPGAFQIAARAMGVSTSELGKMLEAGSVISDEFLPKFAAELQKTFPPGEKAMSGMTAETMRLKTAWFDLKTTVMENGGDSMFTGTIRAMKTLTEVATNWVRASDGIIAKIAPLVSPSGAFATAWGSGALKDAKKPEPMSELSAAMISGDLNSVGPEGGFSYLLGDRDQIIAKAVEISAGVVEAVKKTTKKGLTDQQKEYQQQIKTFLSKAWDNAALELAAEDFGSDVMKKMGLFTDKPTGFTKNPALSLGTGQLQSLEQQAAAAQKLDAAETERLKTIREQVREYARQRDIINYISALESANRMTEASMVGTNASGGFDSIADQTANQLAIQKAAHEERLRMLDIERQAIATKGLSEQQAIEAMAKLDKATALERQKNTIATGKIAADSYKSQLSEASDYTAMASQLFKLLAGTQDESSREGFEAAKKYNMGAVAMNTASAIMAQLTIPGPKGWISAGLAFAAGLVQMDQVSKTTFGGGGSVAAPGSFDLGGSGGGSVGGSIGSRLTSNSDNASQDSLQRLADASDNASRAIGKVAKGFSAIADLFTEGGMASLAAGAAPGTGVGLTSSPSISFTKWLGGAVNPLGNAIKAMKEDNAQAAVAMWDPISAYVTRAAFGGGWNTTAAGMSLGVKGGLASAGDYVTREKDGGWFGSDKKKTTLTDNPEWAAAVNDMLTGAISSITRAAITMGTSANISGVDMAATKIATAGRTPEDIAKDMQAWLEKVAAEMALTVDGLEDYAYQGENAYLALMRLNDALITTNDVFELLGANLIDSTLAGADFAFRLQDLFGGAEAFAESFDIYFTTMYTETEQKAMRAAQAQRQVNDAFAEMNITAPTTRQEFTAIVDSYIAQGEAGAGMLVDLMGIVPAFGLVADAADAAAEAAAAAADHLREIALATEDLTVRNLTALGQNTAAQRLSQQLDMQRAIAEAEQNNMGIEYINRLKNTMALESAAWELQSAISAEKQNIAAQQANQAAQLEAGKRKTQAIYDDQVKAAQSAYDAQVKSSQSAIDGLSGSVNKLESFADSLKSTLEEMRPYTMSEAQAVVDRAIKTRNIGNTDQLSSAVAAMQNIDTGNYATALDYQRDQLMNANRVESLKNIATGQLSSAEQSLKYAQEQLELLKVNHDAQAELLKTKFDEQIASISKVGEDQSAALDRQYEAAITQITALYGINNSVLSVANAMNGFMSAASADALLVSLPRFEAGGITSGLSLAGEIPEAIIPLPDGRRVPVQIQGNSDNYKEVVDELKLLRAEFREMKLNTEKQSKTITKWDKKGMPPEATA